MRHLMIDFNTSLIEAGYLGEHNATELVIVKPVDVIGAMYSVAFMTNGEVIHSKFFNADEQIRVPLWQQLTQDYELGVQLEAYDEKGDYLGKSAMITLLFGGSAHGTDVIADAENPDVYSEIALNTWFRETLEDNVDTLDKLTTSDEGKLLFDGKLIEGAGDGEEILPEYIDQIEANTAFRNKFSEDENGNLLYNGKFLADRPYKTFVINQADTYTISTNSNTGVFVIALNIPDDAVNADVKRVRIMLNDYAEWIDINDISLLSMQFVATIIRKLSYQIDYGGYVLFGLDSIIDQADIINIIAASGYSQIEIEYYI